MKYKIEFTKSAVKEYQSLPINTQKRILEALELLTVNPTSELLHIKKMHGHDNLFRIRIGDYRVLYELRYQVLVILVIKIGHRREVYRNLN